MVPPHDHAVAVVSSCPTIRPLLPRQIEPLVLPLYPEVPDACVEGLQGARGGLRRVEVLPVPDDKLLEMTFFKDGLSNHAASVTSTQLIP